MKLNWNFLGEWRVQNKIPSVRRVWIFSGTAQWDIGFLVTKENPNLSVESQGLIANLMHIFFCFSA